MKQESEKSGSPQSDSVYSDSITLENPIIRGEMFIDKVKLRRPKSGELRGLKIFDVVTTDMDTMIKLLPRITEPPLTEDDIENLELADIFLLTTEFASFLQPKASTAEPQK
jgi:hypothetical protein